MKVIKLQLYKGLKLLFNEQGKVENKNQTIKLVDGEEWLNYLSLIKSQGLCKVTLLSVLEVTGKDAKPVTGDHLNIITSQIVEACGKKFEGDSELRLELPKKGDSDGEKIKNLIDKMGSGDKKTPAEIKEEKKAIRDALKARAAAGNLEFRATMSNDQLEELLIENKL